MSSAMKINGIGIAGERTHNGMSELQILECSDLKYAQRPSLSHSIALNMQYSTACDWFAKSCASIFDISHSYASGLTVTFRRILRDPLGILGIQCQSMPNNLNMNDVVWHTSANNALGLNNHDRKQPISESSESRGGVGNPAPGRRGGRHGRRLSMDAASVPFGWGGPDGAIRGRIHIGALGHSVGLSRVIRMIQRILIDIRTCELTLSQMISEIRRLQGEMPDHEVFLDGDAYAVVARPRRTTV